MKELDRNFSAADGAFELGEIIGQRRAFSAVAGRCSAADAACIKRLRDSKVFKQRCETWEEFCPKYLGMGKSNANRLIRELEELGPEYFHLSQMTKISAHEYRVIQGAVRDGAVHRNGEAIALIPENSEKVADAVAELRRDARDSATPEWKPAIDTLPSIESRGLRLAQDYAELLKLGLNVESRTRVEAALKQLRSALYDAELG